MVEVARMSPTLQHLCSLPESSNGHWDMADTEIITDALCVKRASGQKADKEGESLKEPTYLNPALIGGFFRRGQFVVVCFITRIPVGSITSSDNGSRLNAAVKFNETWV